MSNSAHHTDYSSIAALVAEVSEAEPASVTPKASLREDLGLDSLGIVELVTIIRERFDVTIPENQADGVLTVQDLFDRVNDQPSDGFQLTQNGSPS
ncbi:acyl carrier protein [Streptomyces sp. NPDC006879]|uniref:acyl carrier protein n=1 Tax=Streptomyces sp. NPDC006879 TaxID=3364767 RepID=UPI00367AC877